MKLTGIQVVLLIGALVLGCKPSFQIRKYRPASEVKGIVYALPRTMVRVTIPLSLVFKETLVPIQEKKKGGAADTPRKYQYQWKKSEVPGPIVVETYPIPDPEHYYEIDMPSRRGIFSDSTFSVALSKEQYLTQSTAHSRDQSLSAVAGLVKNIAGILKPAGPGKKQKPGDAATELSNLKTKLESVNTALYATTLAAASSPTTAAGKPLLEALQKRLDLLKQSRTVLKARMGKIKVRKVKTVEASITCSFDLKPPAAKRQSKTPGYNRKKYAIGHLITPENCGSLNKLVESLASIDAGNARKYWFGVRKNSGLPNANQRKLPITDGTNFYVYRIPYNGSYELRRSGSSGAILAKGQVSLAQFGKLAKLRVEMARFDDNSVTIKLHPETGGIASVEKKSITTAGTNLADITSGLYEIGKHTTVKKDVQDKIKASTDRVNAQLEYLKKSMELEKLIRTGEVDEED